jgi:hypothetical membrane protein
MTSKASSEGPEIPTVDPPTNATSLRAAGFLLVTGGIALCLVGAIGLLFLFMVPALIFVVMGVPLVVVGSRWFASGKSRFAQGPGQAD